MIRSWNKSLHLPAWAAPAIAGMILFSMNSIAQTPLEPPPGKIYLGAFVNPDGTNGFGNTSARTVVDFEKLIGRKLALDLHYYKWKELAGMGAHPFPSTETDPLGDGAQGRIPVISWNCGAPNAEVASGMQDNIITAAAQKIRHYGGPVLLRYMWEMNLPVTANNRQPVAMGGQGCAGPHDDIPCHLANGKTSVCFSPADFKLAWKHIREVFDQQHVTNAVWLFNPGQSGEQDFGAFYPGDNEVDWIGIDVYDRHKPAEAVADEFHNIINPVYQDLITKVSASKPILVGETAALPANQANYLNANLAITDLRRDFPNIKGLVYWDSRLVNRPDWILDEQGLKAFTTLGKRCYMTAMLDDTSPGHCSP
jgi:hypothetical protein